MVSGQLCLIHLGREIAVLKDLGCFTCEAEHPTNPSPLPPLIHYVLTLTFKTPAAQGQLRMKDVKQDNDSRNQSRASNNWQQSPKRKQQIARHYCNNASTIHLSILYIIDAYKAGCKESRHTNLNRNAEQDRQSSLWRACHKH